MTPQDAAKLLELPPDATPEQIETRFLELRRRFEDKIARAPTPGLQAKYRESLAEITAAFEALALAADTTALPVLQKQKTEGGENKPAGEAVAPLRGPEAGIPKPKIQNRKSGKEFLLVAAIAVVVLGAGGWWVMKTKAENEEKARIAAEQKAEQERIAAAKKKAEDEEKARLEQIRVQLRTVVAEAKVVWDIAERAERDSERRLSDLRAEQRAQRDPKPEDATDVRLRLESAQRYAGWLRDYLLTHPLKVGRARLEELIPSPALQEAEALAVEVRTAMQDLRSDLAVNPGGEGSIELATNLPTAGWKLVDPAGRTRTGTGAARIDGLLFDRYEIVFTHPGFTAARSVVRLEPGKAPRIDQPFEFVRIALKDLPADARVFLSGPEGAEPWPALPDGTFAGPVKPGYWFFAQRPGHIPAGAAYRREGETEFTLQWLDERNPGPIIAAALALLDRAADPDASLWADAVLQVIDRSLGLQPIPGPDQVRLLRQALDRVMAMPVPSDDPEKGKLVRSDQHFWQQHLIRRLEALDRAAAGAAVGRFIAWLEALPAAELGERHTVQGFLAAYPEVARAYVAKLRPALTTLPLQGYERSTRAADIHLALLTYDPAEAEVWRNAYLRDFPGDSYMFTDFEKKFAWMKIENELLRQLWSRDYGKFNSLSQDGLPVEPSYYTWELTEHLLLQRFENQALQFNLAANSPATGSLLTYLQRGGRLNLLDGYFEKLRQSWEDRASKARYANVLALRGNATRAREILPEPKENYEIPEATVVQALLGDAAKVASLIDSLDSLKYDFSNAHEHSYNIPRMAAAAEAVGDHTRARRLFDRAGIRDPGQSADRLASFGRHDAVFRLLPKSDGTKGSELGLFQFYHLRPDLRGRMPWVYGWRAEIGLLASYLEAIATRAGQNPANLNTPHTKYLPPREKKRTEVFFPSQYALGGQTITEGNCTILVRVGADAKAKSYTVVSTTHPAFPPELYTSVAQWEFYPALRLGQPAEGDFELKYSFKLRR